MIQIGLVSWENVHRYIYSVCCAVPTAAPEIFIQIYNYKRESNL